jgi:hypothetical protein
MPFVETVLGGVVSLVPIHRFDDASEMLRSECDLALILCGVHFDESRMYDLLRLARESQPHIPFVACRVLETRLSHISVQAIAIAAEALGAKAFVDLPTLILEFGRENAGPLFRSRCSRAWVGAPYAAAPNLAQGGFPGASLMCRTDAETRFRSCPYLTLGPALAVARRTRGPRSRSQIPVGTPTFINLRIEEGAVRTGMPSFVSSCGVRSRAYPGVRLPS